MDFTFKAYEKLVTSVLNNGYAIKNYNNWQESEKSVIFRHDVDFDISKAAEFSLFEKELFGGGAVYNLLLSTNMYNIFSYNSKKNIENILNNGGKIGLHFDETQYEISSLEELENKIIEEMDILSSVVGFNINVVSMHRPSTRIIVSDIRNNRFVNTYSKTYLSDMKYVSDSRRHWREPVIDIIESAQFNRLHILTHPIWYSNEKDRNIYMDIVDFINRAPIDRYDNLLENITDLGNVVEKSSLFQDI